MTNVVTSQQVGPVRFDRSSVVMAATPQEEADTAEANGGMEIVLTVAGCTLRSGSILVCCSRFTTRGNRECFRRDRRRGEAAWHCASLAHHSPASNPSFVYACDGRLHLRVCVCGGLVVTSELSKVFGISAGWSGSCPIRQSSLFHSRLWVLLPLSLRIRERGTKICVTTLSMCVCLLPSPVLVPHCCLAVAAL